MQQNIHSEKRSKTCYANKCLSVCNICMYMDSQAYELIILQMQHICDGFSLLFFYPYPGLLNIKTYCIFICPLQTLWKFKLHV